MKIEPVFDITIPNTDYYLYEKSANV